MTSLSNLRQQIDLALAISPEICLAGVIDLLLFYLLFFLGTIDVTNCLLAQCETMHRCIYIQ